MMTIQNMKSIIELIEYKDWTIDIYSNDEGTPYLQVSFFERDLVTGQLSIQKSRKWLMSYHMTVSEVVQTAFKAVLTAEEHELREKFRYKNRTIFGPHFHVDALVELAKSKENLDMRTGVWVA